MFKVGQVLYKRYDGVVIRDGGNPVRGGNERVFVTLYHGGEYVWIDGALFTVEPDGNGLSWKTFFSEV